MSREDKEALLECLLQEISVATSELSDKQIDDMIDFIGVMFRDGEELQ